MLKRSDSVPADSRQGGPSRNRTGTHQPEVSRSRANEAAALPSPQVVLSCGSTGTTTASDSLPAAAHFPAPHRLQDRAFRAFPQDASSGEGLSSSRRHHLNVPRPLTPESPSRLHPRIFTASMAFAVNRPARLSPRCLTTRQASLALRTAQLLPLKGLSTLGSDPARFQARPPACYRAPWRLPGPDFHRQATTSFRSGHDRWTITSVISGRTGWSTSRRSRWGGVTSATWWTLLQITYPRRSPEAA